MSEPSVLREPIAPSRRPEKVSEYVAREILHDIVERALEPGARLPPEAAMLATYQVARSSLREGLRILEFHGLIRIRPGVGGGPMVASVQSGDFARMSTMYFHVTRTTLRELFQARLSIETEMAAYAARSRDPRLLEALRESLQDAELLDAAEDDSAHSSAAREFHHIITSMSGNRILGLLAQSIKDVYVARVRNTPYPPEVRREVHAAHKAIAAEILEGDDVRAAALMRAHMQDYLERSVLTDLPGLLDEVIDWR